MVVAFALLLSSFPASAQFDQILKGINKPKGSDNGQVASGLKQALEVGTKNTVSKVGVPDGYFANAAIKILMPDKLRPLEKGLRMMGKGPEIDSFVLAMNRAAEKAAPGARRIFLDAITGMSFEDARGILSGGDTAATAYFKEKTADKLRAAFQPVVESRHEPGGRCAAIRGIDEEVRIGSVCEEGDVRYQRLCCWQEPGWTVLRFGRRGKENQDKSRRAGHAAAERSFRQALLVIS